MRGEDVRCLGVGCVVPSAVGGVRGVVWGGWCRVDGVGCMVWSVE